MTTGDVLNLLLCKRTEPNKSKDLYLCCLYSRTLQISFFTEKEKIQGAQFCKSFSRLKKLLYSNYK